LTAKKNLNQYLIYEIIVPITKVNSYYNKLEYIYRYNINNKLHSLRDKSSSKISE